MTNNIEDRLELLEQLQITYPRLNKIIEKIKHCHEISRISAEPANMLITGWQGVGKTTLCKNYEQKYPRLETEEGSIVPVLSASIPVPASVKALVTALLLALGDPAADKGSTVSQTIRAYELVKVCKTELIILDEFQHIIDRKLETVLQNTADWLKTFVNETKIPVILMGMPSCKIILESNPQLRRRFLIREELKPFGWSTPGTNNEIQQLLTVIDGKLPLKKRSNLSDPEMAYRFFCATSGIMSSFMILIRGAAREALKSGSEIITPKMLADVYEKHLSSIAPEFANPFTENSDILKIIPFERITESIVNSSRRKKV